MKRLEHQHYLDGLHHDQHHREYGEANWERIGLRDDRERLWLSTQRFEEALQQITNTLKPGHCLDASCRQCEDDYEKALSIAQHALNPEGVRSPEVTESST